MLAAEYINLLDSNTAAVLSTVKAVPAKALAVEPEGKWSILQILEHICITEKLVFIVVSKSSGQVSDSAEILGDEKLKRSIVDLRQRKITAPDSLHPKGRIKSTDDFVTMFLAGRNQLKEHLLSGKIVIDNRVHKHLILGEMTITDWLHFYIHHTNRHIEQVKDIVSETAA